MELEGSIRFLESDVFEPMEEKSFERCRVKAIILMMLATGRRLDEVQTLQTWRLG